jgi:hypothetical protein
MKIILEMTFTTTSKLRHVRPHLPHRPWASRGTGLSFTTVANPSSAWWARASRTASPTPSWCWERPVPKATTSSGSCGGYVLLIPLSHLLFPAGTMTLSSSPQRIALAIAFFGLLAFILGVVAENKKVQPFL